MEASIPEESAASPTTWEAIEDQEWKHSTAAGTAWKANSGSERNRAKGAFLKDSHSDFEAKWGADHPWMEHCHRHHICFDVVLHALPGSVPGCVLPVLLGCVLFCMLASTWRSAKATGSRWELSISLQRWTFMVGRPRKCWFGRLI